MNKHLLLILLLSFTHSFTQEHSMHKADYLTQGSIVKEKSFFDESGKDIIPLINRDRDLTHSVFGYLPDWEYLTARNYLRYDLLTHIAAFDFEVSSSGNITNPSYWPWTDVINTAHQNGVKVILTAVNFNADAIRNIMTNPTAKMNFFTQAVSLMQQYQLDGINVDFEGLHTADRGTVVNNFMADLNAFVKSALPAAEVSFAAPPVNWSNHWILSGLAEACDYLFIMGYAFYGSFSSSTGPSSPLTGGSVNITNTVNVQYSSVVNSMPHKLILGIPYYGLRWKTQTSQPQSTVISYIGSTRFKNDVTDVLLHGKLWSSTHQTPWYRYQQNNEWYQVWFDDDSSISLKYDLAVSKNLKGVGMWALGYDGNRNELWNLINDKFYYPVPVEMQSFTAENLDNKILLTWITATEKNNKGFELQRRIGNGEIINLNNRYQSIAFIPGNGTTTEQSEYKYIDQPPSNRKYNYKLIQIDFDGTRTELEEIEVETGIPFDFFLYQNHPNPFNPSTKIKFETNRSQHIDISVYDILGRKTAQLINEEKAAGFYEVVFDASSLPGGVYFYQMKTAGFTSTKKMIIIR
jgi:spore germination protein YaaH